MQYFQVFRSQCQQITPSTAAVPPKLQIPHAELMRLTRNNINYLVRIYEDTHDRLVEKNLKVLFCSFC